ncbi:hypothetical protein Tco_1452039, partial [Tanacetum coccineum]
MVAGLPHFSSSSYVCEECTLSKQHQEPFPKGKTQWAKKLLEIVHSDIYGPIDPTSIGEPDFYYPEYDSRRGMKWEETRYKPHTQLEVPTDLDGDSSYHHDEDFVQPQVVESTATEESAIPIRDIRSSRVRRRQAWMSDFDVTG